MFDFLTTPNLIGLVCIILLLALASLETHDQYWRPDAVRGGAPPEEAAEERPKTD